MDFLEAETDWVNCAAEDLWGVVVAIQANYYWVQPLSQRTYSPAQRSPVAEFGGQAGTHLLCYCRARLRKIGQQVMVGDQVRVEDPDWAGGRGAISAVQPRKTVLDRPPIANVDQVLLMFALAEPDLDPQQLSRFLVKAESTQLEVCLCLNKKDLVSPEIQESWRQRLSQWGYHPQIVSVQAEHSLQDLARQLQSHTTVIAGPSGVGKSSLINQLIPYADLRTNTVSGKLGRGRHTTRHVELFELPCGGLLADTPGFNQPDIDLTFVDLGNCFPEIRERLREHHCQFKDCLHRDEPGCAVGRDWERYAFYLDLLEELMAQREAFYQRRDEETNLKIKVGEAGQIQHEPKLHELRYDLPESIDDLESVDEFEADWH